MIPQKTTNQKTCLKNFLKKFMVFCSRKSINASLEKRGITNRVNFEFDLFADLIRSTGNMKG